jgi:hypothetical protein
VSTKKELFDQAFWLKRSWYRSNHSTYTIADAASCLRAAIPSATDQEIVEAIGAVDQLLKVSNELALKWWNVESQMDNGKTLTAGVHVEEQLQVQVPGFSDNVYKMAIGDAIYNNK